MHSESRFSESHPSDQDLLLAADGELPLDGAARVAAHLSACRSCRARKQEMKRSAGVTQMLRGNLAGEFPPPDGPRTLLKARLARWGPQPPDLGHGGMDGRKFSGGDGRPRQCSLQQAFSPGIRTG